MSLMRGIADDRPLMEWLTDHIWPLEQKWMGEAFVRDGSDLAIHEGGCLSEGRQPCTLCSVPPRRPFIIR